MRGKLPFFSLLPPKNCRFAVSNTPKTGESNLKTDAMFKNFILFFALLTSFAATAQTETDVQHKVYCEIVGSGNITGTKVKIEADLGQKRIRDTWGGDAARKIVGEDGQEIKFNSMMDAVNFFASLGWSLEFTYAVTDTGMSKQTVYHYVMSKTVTSNEEISHGLKFKK